MPLTIEPAEVGLEYGLSGRSIATVLKAMPNEELVRSCQAGVQAAMSELIERFRSRIFYTAYGLTRNRDEAEDVTVTACIRICSGIRTCKFQTALPTWIHRIVLNVWLDSVRSKKRHPEVSLDVLDVISLERMAVASRVAPVFRYAEENERNEILASAIATLPQMQVKIIKLFYTDGCSYKDITEQMGIPVGTVKSCLNRARISLRRKLDHQQVALID